MSKLKNKSKSKSKSTSLENILNDIDGFFKSNKYTQFDDFDNAAKQALYDNKEGYFEGDMEQVSRDLFSIRGFLKKELAALPFLSGAQELLYLTETDDDDITIMVGDIYGDIPWALAFNASIGEYCDDDFDIFGSYEIFIGNKNSIFLDLKMKSTSQLKRAFEAFSYQSKNALDVLSTYFPNEQKSIEENLVNHFLETELGQKLFPLIDKKLLTESLPQPTHSKNKAKKTL